jgi:ferredoxin-type protein NapH
MNLRRRFQTASLFVLSIGPIAQEQFKWLCLPILHCHSCPIAVFSCPIGIMGHYLALGIIPIMLIGMIVFIGALVGRALCGWVCPFGFLQELLYKIPSPKLQLWSPLKYGKYIVLGIFSIMVPFLWGVESVWYFCRVCPAAAFEASLPYGIMLGGFSNVGWAIFRFSLAILVLVMSVFTIRFFCRVFCPVGAITALLNPISAFALRHNTSACPSCGQCVKACPVGVDLQNPTTMKPEGYRYKAPMDCILCLECTSACPKANGLVGSFLGMAKTPKVSVQTCEECER